jgi:superfamily II DNA or RNA helicase
MRAFADDITAHVTQKEVEEAAAKGANEEQLSIRDILASQDTTARITNPRDYQTELFQRAKMQNTIAVLGTGTGKTHIATLLLRHILEEELEHRAKGSIHKIAFFLVKQPLSSYQIHANMNRSTQSAWCSNKPMFYAAVLIRMSKVSVALLASRYTRKAPGVNFSPTTWS